MVRFGSKVVYVADPEDIWGNVHKVGNAELAARLGSINMFERRGDTFWMDNFESAVLRWELAAGEAGTTAILSNVRALSGEQSMRVDTGDAGNNYIRCTRPLAYPILGKLGFEISNTYHAYIDRLLWEFKLYTGTDVIIAAVEWENSSNKLYYKSADNNSNQFPAGTVTEFETDVDFNLVWGGFNICKLVVDFTTGKYVRFIHNNTIYDMSDLFYFTESEAVTPPNMYVRVGVDGGDGAGFREATVYYDNAIVTQNEV